MPVSLTSKLDSITQNFGWNGSKEGKAVNLCKWDSLCSDKNDGGMGFRSFQDMNLALVAKLLWKVLTDKKSLWAKVMQARYGKFLKLFEEEKTPNWLPLFLKV
ncbi:hypothetical protein FRX31_033290 [Thalictrum thalictroides]|uniref:Uncharacterized protein n=1 Tax=Thalictrum thalictroides TaxID=46969 RepID=A0A7J6UWY2_THATH|nr:hypothetical protein FRX31_033290 [Thalictrum thalictroides]